MPRLIVQGTTPGAVQYGVRSFFDQHHSDKFRGGGRRATKRRQVVTAAVSGCLAYQASTDGGNFVRFCSAYPSRTAEIERLRAELTDAAWRSVRSSIGGLLLSWFAGWIVSLVVDLLLEWFLSAESETFRLSAKGDA